ncbi:uncharacterized protein LOC107998115 isoform X1 [Apis cerana]|uniref:uncharacterized protein LOC107998115 isoform X1 n=1 Tax=Apis cerana TaxID=7461 RepID=UPI002B22E6C3|nr:uncharacterized protein LOC107998115 isoform X1 [Apis cerana]
MARIVSVLCIVCLVLTIVLAKPVPQQNNNGEVLAPKNTLYYPYAFWFVRPYYDQDDIDVGSFQLERRPSTISYANVGINQIPIKKILIRNHDTSHGRL